MGHLKCTAYLYDGCGPETPKWLILQDIWSISVRINLEKRHSLLVSSENTAVSLLPGVGGNELYSLHIKSTLKKTLLHPTVFLCLWIIILRWWYSYLQYVCTTLLYTPLVTSLNNEECFNQSDTNTFCGVKFRLYYTYKTCLILTWLSFCWASCCIWMKHKNTGLLCSLSGELFRHISYLQ